MYDFLFTNASVIDGSGAAPYTADIGVSDGKIVAISPSLQVDASRKIDLDGRILAPGFIDIHRHADAALLRPEFGEAELFQGITTIVNGNCGMSVTPLSLPYREEVLGYLSPVVGSLPAGVEFESFSSYVSLLKRRALPLNIGSHVGSGTMRATAIGYREKSLSNSAQKLLHQSLEEAMSAGALGVSVGFSYMPDLYYSPEELAEALAPMRGTDIPLVCHVRGEGDMLYESVREAIEAAKLLSVPLHLSHFKCIGRRNWGTLLGKTIELIEDSRQSGTEIMCDVYPWAAGSTQMACLLPPQFLQGGPTQVVERLADTKKRKVCRDIMSRPSSEFENIAESMGWQSIYVSGLGSEKNRWCIGKSIVQIAEIRKVDPFDAACDLLVEENCNVTMVDYITCEEDIETILRLNYSCLISDAIYPDSGLPHPRGYGNVAMFLSEYVKKRGTLTIEQAVHKMTALPAKAMRIKTKGLIREGFDADIVVIEKDGIRSEADFENPTRLTEGIYLAMVNGKIVLEGGSITGAMSGRYVRR
ncbi:MAG: amidohydrolase family protein [Oscillospiraceae bacterium]|nr:amidohydrolase family protein [Oscillospiraceae bacterium]